MRARTVAWIVAAWLCAGAAWYLLGAGRGPTPTVARGTSESAPPRGDDPPPLASLPARSPSESQQAKDVPTPAPGPVQKDPHSPWSIDDLLAHVRREVEPGFWGGTPGAALEAKNGVLIARATTDVLEAIGVRLEALRGSKERDLPASSGDPVSAEELRNVMRGMLDRHHRLDSAARLLRADPDAALRMLEEVEREEPDNFAVKELRLAHSDGSRPAVVAAAALRGPLEEWLFRWPSKATWARLSELRAKAGPAGAMKLGLQRDELLSRGSLTVRLQAVPLWMAIRRLQIEALCEITLASDLAPELETRSVSLDLESRSLGVALDALVSQLPAGHRWVPTRGSLVIARAETAGETIFRLRFFDVKDLLGQGPATPKRAPGDAPPAPPVYQAPK